MDRALKLVEEALISFGLEGFNYLNQAEAFREGPTYFHQSKAQLQR